MKTSSPENTTPCCRLVLAVVLLSAAGVAALLPSPAAAGWQAHDYAAGSRGIYLNDETGAVVTMAVIGNAGELSLKNTAAFLAARGSCKDPEPRKTSGVPGFLMTCPGDIAEYLFDDGVRIMLAAAHCRDAASCPGLNDFIGEFGRKGDPLPEPLGRAPSDIRARMDEALRSQEASSADAGAATGEN